MIQRMNATLLLLTAMSVLFMNTANAADIETLLMPGKVIQGHAKYESECSRCHARFKKSTQSQLCRDCHEKIDADLLAGEGFGTGHRGLDAIGQLSCGDAVVGGGGHE